MKGRQLKTTVEKEQGAWFSKVEPMWIRPNVELIERRGGERASTISRTSTIKQPTPAPVYISAKTTNMRIGRITVQPGVSVGVAVFLHQFN